jgi:membrane protease YdiL (CAAX protease family)
MTVTQILLLVSEWLGVGSVTWIAGLSPRFHRRPITFIYQRRENIISFSLFALALLACFFIKLELDRTEFSTILSLPDVVFLRLLLSIVLLAPFLIALVYRRQPIRTIGWGKTTLRPAFQLGLGLAILVIFLHGKIFSLINNFSSTQGFLFLALLVTALIEESVFRGFIQIRLDSGFGRTTGLIVTALLFTLWRAAFFIARGSTIEVIIPSIVVTLVQSLMLGWIVQKSGHIISPALYRSVSDFMQYLP